VQKTLQIIEYFQPERWWLETPRYGLLTKQKFMAAYPSWDVDYCQFGSQGFQKPTRFYGSKHLSQIPPALCDENCPNLGLGRKHLRPLGGHQGAATKRLTYTIPLPVVEIACGFETFLGKVNAVKDATQGKKMVRFSMPPSENPPQVAPEQSAIQFEQGEKSPKLGAIPPWSELSPQEPDFDEQPQDGEEFMTSQEDFDEQPKEGAQGPKTEVQGPPPRGSRPTA
jgi:hypothetical protein